MEPNVDQPTEAKLETEENAAPMFRSNGSRFTGDVAVEPYDFRRPAALSQVHLRQVELVHQKFVEHLAARLSAFLRHGMQCEAGQI